jgi:hypothetical protein
VADIRGRGLAQQMCESRDYSAMPILTDALQDAGCDSAGILTLCRGLGLHALGCWIVDLVLGKEWLHCERPFEGVVLNALSLPARAIPQPPSRP